MLDSIVYGNPTMEQLPFLEASSFLDKHFEPLSKFSPPLNSSKATREELNILVDYTKTITQKKEILQRYRTYDCDLEKVFADICIKFNLEEDIIVLIDQLFDDINPLLIKLKMHFQRPRPYQLSHAYRLKLFPFNSSSSNTPSYPSGHALQSKIICYVLGNHLPEHYDYFESLANDICYSREYLGLHYPSDIDFAILCYETIIRDKDFKVKYKI